MPTPFWRRGHRAERRAAQFLKRNHLTIIETNVRVGRDEIDIVALEGDTVVFVEVRFRSDGIESAFLSLEGQKGHRLRRAVRAYRSREHLWQVDCRIDVVAVTRFQKRWHISHVRGVY